MQSANTTKPNPVREHSIQKSPEHRWTLEYPNLSTAPFDIEPYKSPEAFEKDKNLIFRKTWLHMGRQEELPNPGDFIVKELPLFSTSILLVRGRDGRIRGFHNVCKHRANRVEHRPFGNAANCRFKCRFHGFTYSEVGGLVEVPEESKFFSFKKEEHGLEPVTTDVWEGFIFIHMEKEPPETLLQFMGPYVEDLKGLPFDQMPVCYTYETDLNCNWRLLRDSQLEIYHVQDLHRFSLPEYTAGNPLDPDSHTNSVRLDERHGVVSWFMNPSLRPTPVQALAHTANVGKGDSGASGGSAGAWQATALRNPRLVNPKKTKDWFLDYIYIFPNFHLLPFEGAYITHHMWPVTATTSHWEARLYLPRATNASQMFARENLRVMTREVWLEDGSTLEYQQLGINSGAVRHFPLQDQELLIRHANSVCDQYWDRFGTRG